VKEKHREKYGPLLADGPNRKDETIGQAQSYRPRHPVHLPISQLGQQPYRLLYKRWGPKEKEAAPSVIFKNYWTSKSQKSCRK